MNQYRPVVDAMAAGTPHDLICATCPWDRLCIQPPEMTSDQVSTNIKKVKAEAEALGASPHDRAMTTITAAAIFGGRDQMGMMCPVFVARLRADDGRKLADQVRATMRAAAA